jgi:hypothetical protein
MLSRHTSYFLTVAFVVIPAVLSTRVNADVDDDNDANDDIELANGM